MLDNSVDKVMDEIIPETGTLEEEVAEVVKDECPDVVQDKHSKFRRLAEARVTKVLKAVENVSYLANRSAYSYSAEEVNEIFDAIEGAVNDAREAFKGKSKKSGFSFKC